jgi:SAM-dependent methyltransferase
MNPVDYKKTTMNAYNLVAAKVAGEFDKFFERSARLQADQFLATLEQGSIILDLGCGGGPASRYFKQRGFKPVSADLSAGMLYECRHRGSTTLVRLDMETLPFQLDTFDAIWAHTSLLHLPKEKFARTVEAVGQTLKPGGTLFLALSEGKGERYVNWAGADMWFTNFAGDEFAAYAPKGFEIIRHTRTQLNSRVFLNYHLVKKSEY